MADPGLYLLRVSCFFYLTLVFLRSQTVYVANSGGVLPSDPNKEPADPAHEEPLRQTKAGRTALVPVLSRSLRPPYPCPWTAWPLVLEGSAVG